MERIPITKAYKLDELDEKEVVEGYLDGFHNEPKPNNNRSYSYWHGWRNGQVDAGHALADAPQMELAKDVVHTGYFKGTNPKELSHE